MQYSKVFIDSIGYEIAPVVVTTSELEARLDPVYKKLHINQGQLTALTGIEERRWWEEGYPISKGAAHAALNALESSNVDPENIEMFIYGGVCRENYEPATACRVADSIGRINPNANIYDISNACLGVLNGIIDIANSIELGHIKAGMVVSCESAREINDTMIEKMLQDKSMELFTKSIATLTGGSGAIAVVVTDGSFSNSGKGKLVGGITQNAPQYHSLCKWGIDKTPSHEFKPFMSTDSVSVLKYGVELGLKTWNAFLDKLGWSKEQIGKVICHQVGSGHQDTILKTLDIPKVKDFTTYEYLGNIGTVSLPITAAIAEERGFINCGDKVAFLGIGSGLNCMMLGLEW